MVLILTLRWRDEGTAVCCSTSSRLLGWGVSVRTGPLSRLRLGVLLAGGGLGGRGAEQLGDGSLLFAGFPFDVLA